MTTRLSPRPPSPLSSPHTGDAPARQGVHAEQARRIRLARRADSLFIPGSLFFLFFLLYALTATNSHTFDGIAYIRDMGKPLAAMVLPHHLIYEPAVFSFFSLWRLLGWTGNADIPAQLLSSLAGAGGVAVFYKLAWELSRSRAAALLAALALALGYGYWFYSVEVEIYVPPLFFLLLATWLLSRAASRPRPYLFWLVGLCHAVAALIHQGALFIVPAFALGIFLIGGTLRQRVTRVVSYGVALAAVVGPAYLFAGVVIAGQGTPEAFMRWANNYGQLGTWGVWRNDSLEATVSGLSASVSSGFWVGRLLVAALLALVLMRAVPITRRGGPLAWTLWAWFVIYGIFFAWWQPENLKFWVLMLPAPLLLALMAFDWSRLPMPRRNVALAAGTLAVALLAMTNAPTIWAKRDPMEDPARRVSDALGTFAAPEDLIVLQAGNAEHYLPFYYNRINIMSTRELWYLAGGAGGREAALQSIRQRMWHALAKGSSVWLEGRVLTPGEQISDHYVFTPAEIDRLLSPYGLKVEADEVTMGPEPFYRLSPENAYSPRADWTFTDAQSGWSGVNVSNERIGNRGWCFTPLQDPNLYGPPIRLTLAAGGQVEIQMTTAYDGEAQLFYRTGSEPYSEERSITFKVSPDREFYIFPTAELPGRPGTITGLRFDPPEAGDVTGSVDTTICVKSIRAGSPKTLLVDNRAKTR